MSPELCPRNLCRKYTPEETEEEILPNKDVLRSKPFFLSAPAELFDSATGSEFVRTPVIQTSLDEYYDDNQVPNVSVCDWLLAEAIPATTLPMGANYNERLGDINNFNMTNDNVGQGYVFMTEGIDLRWPENRIIGANKQWWHSDYVKLPYQYVYKLYDKIEDLTK